MRAGDLDRLVRIEVNTPTRATDGGEIDAWGLFAEVAAQRLDAKGREFFAGDELTGEAVTVWRLRWLAGVKTAMRVVDGSEIWDIKSAVEFGGRREGLDLACARLGV
jgi:head-tail adaptor